MAVFAFVLALLLELLASCLDVFAGVVATFSGAHGSAAPWGFRVSGWSAEEYAKYVFFWIVEDGARFAAAGASLSAFACCCWVFWFYIAKYKAMSGLLVALSDKLARSLARSEEAALTAAKLQSALDSRKAEVSRLLVQLATARASGDSLGRRIEAAESRARALDEDLTTERRNFATMALNWEVSKEEREEDVAELKADISDLQGKLNAAHEAKGVLQEEVEWKSWEAEEAIRGRSHAEGGKEQLEEIVKAYERLYGLLSAEDLDLATAAEAPVDDTGASTTTAATETTAAPAAEPAASYQALPSYDNTDTQKNACGFWLRSHFRAGDSGCLYPDSCKHTHPPVCTAWLEGKCLLAQGKCAGYHIRPCKHTMRGPCKNAGNCNQWHPAPSLKETVRQRMSRGG